jgi:hypothetical protein
MLLAAKEDFGTLIYQLDKDKFLLVRQIINFVVGGSDLKPAGSGVGVEGGTLARFWSGLANVPALVLFLSDVLFI